jgi:branched-chain amino acid transport system permease protein
MNAYLIFGLFTVVMVMGLGLLFHLQHGLAGIGQFGIVGFWGIGMYSFGVLYAKVDWPFDDPFRFGVCLLLATALSGVAGAAIGWLIGDLNTDGILVGTLGFAAALSIVVTEQRQLTGGVVGLSGLVIPFSVGNRSTTEAIWLLVLAGLVTALLAYVHMVHRAPYGRLLIAIGANEPLARSLGKPTTREKILLFMWTSAVMGLFGAMYGMLIHFLTPLKLGVDVTLAVMVAVVLGGSGRAWGAVVGTLLTVGLFDIVINVYLPIPNDIKQQALPVAKEAAFGLLLILVLMYLPSGVLGPMRRERLLKGLNLGRP